jgi:hypothetical protein
VNHDVEDVRRLLGGWPGAVDARCRHGGNCTPARALRKSLRFIYQVRLLWFRAFLPGVSASDLPNLNHVRRLRIYETGTYPEEKDARQHAEP